MFCPKCKKKLYSNSSKKCPFCGADIPHDDEDKSKKTYRKFETTNDAKKSDDSDKKFIAVPDRKQNSDLQNHSKPNQAAKKNITATSDENESGVKKSTLSASEIKNEAVQQIPVVKKNNEKPTEKASKEPIPLPKIMSQDTSQIKADRSGSTNSKNNSGKNPEKVPLDESGPEYDTNIDGYYDSFDVDTHTDKIIVNVVKQINNFPKDSVIKYIIIVAAFFAICIFIISTI